MVSRKTEAPRVYRFFLTPGFEMASGQSIRVGQVRQCRFKKKKLGCGLMVFCLLLFSSSGSLGAGKTFLPNSEAAK